MELSRDEFYRAVDGLKGDLREDLTAIRSHLATLNGRVGKGEIESENHRTRLVALEKTLFKRRQADRAGDGEEWAAAFSKREYALMSLGFGIIYALIQGLQALGGVAWHAVKAGVLR